MLACVVFLLRLPSLHLRRRATLWVWAFFLGSAFAMPAETPLEALEARAAEVERELGKLPLATVQGGIGSVGFESAFHQSPQQSEWVRVDWGEAVQIDQIVLVPLLWQAGRSGYTACGFPVKFRVVAGTATDKEGTVIASYDEGDGLLPRSAPLVIPCDTTASWVRVEASLLSRRSPRTDEMAWSLQFSEVLVFSGQENVALHSAVTTSSSGEQEGNRRHRKALADGYMPYEMMVADHKSSPAAISWSKPGDRLSLLIDLGESLPINQIHLFAIDSSQTSPRDIPGDYGVPDHLVIEGANREDFSDAVVLVDRKKKDFLDAGQILMLRFPESRCRFLRLTSLKNHDSRITMGFAEIEVLSEGKNVALGKKAKISGTKEVKRIESLTDGQNLHGRILPLKHWLGDLARRHNLENELPRIEQEIQSHYARQKNHLAVLGWLAALALAGGVLATLVLQIVKMRQIASLRERFAADLHDELGANLHSIGMLAGLAREDLHSPKELEGTLDEIKSLVASTGLAARYCIEKQTNPLNHNLPEDMRNISRRILADIEWNLDVVGEEHLRGLHGTLLDDLFLFYKECLVNISRHSMATRVHATLHADAKSIELQVEDNGRGLGGSTPKSLKRRARLLGGHATTRPRVDGGVVITLKLRRPLALLFSKLIPRLKTMP